MSIATEPNLATGAAGIVVELLELLEMEVEAELDCKSENFFTVGMEIVEGGAALEFE